MYVIGHDLFKLTVLLIKLLVSETSTRQQDSNVLKHSTSVPVAIVEAKQSPRSMTSQERQFSLLGKMMDENDGNSFNFP